MKCEQAINNPQVQEAMRAALAAQLTLWAKLADLENLVKAYGDNPFQDSLMEFAIGVDDSPDAIPVSVIQRAIVHVCFGHEDENADEDEDEDTDAN
jgi:hypothetical protein